MLNRQGNTTRAMLRQTTNAARHTAAAPDQERGSNDQIRALLKAFGLRTSLVRLKVLDTLLAASTQGQALGVRGIHSQLVRLDVPLSFLSVREVLKRLCDEGVIVLGDDKTYSLHSRALHWLDIDPGSAVP
ncbi:Fe2+/Zn2+ uptake regulation protein [Pseudomonas sp. DTU_2021_1001937_2_SI_NGA_ILE_001]|uniref:Fe2+/Zn2+ uptake regulation protein n=1 Tax=Pseudomonas sp. DTU_2021_1001937_2_SI_NGA_ILE_001 TaxID=3077589 RepID=UPI0028FC23C7|nr:Fe2+/Zn2+ uptake regulation protein [Pseudomonas sp. DTU_2021_1001937_2_SI_NGA_ILE_001]WNW10644.1 Fe2+/Zn2+ uptake regulation protein [Pseudomonas sp. DTU_2021_1001937_2_SI_NGA_ILE_001]